MTFGRKWWCRGCNKPHPYSVERCTDINLMHYCPDTCPYELVSVKEGSVIFTDAVQVLLNGATIQKGTLGQIKKQSEEYRLFINNLFLCVLGNHHLPWYLAPGD